MNTRHLIATLSLGLALCATGCHHSVHLDSLMVNLTWSPSSNSDVSSAVTDAFLNQKVEVKTFGDVRTVKEIGKNTEEAGNPRPVTTQDDVAKFVTEHVASVLQSNHVTVVPSGATRTLRGDVVEFFTQEDNTYQSTVTLRFSLLDASGKEIFIGTGTGHAKRFGHSMDPQNYNETLSEGIAEAVRDVLKNPAFLAAAHAGK